MHKIAARLMVLFICPLVLCSCATTNLKSFGSIQGKITLEEDENRIWKRTDEEKERFDASGELYHDQILEEYVNSVLLKIVPDDIEASGLKIKAKIIDDPRLNAFCFPDGTIYLHTGILARMDNEAQLATLLGHEVTHAINRHAVKFFRDIKNKTAFYNTFSVVSAGAGGPAGELISMLGAYGTLAAIYGYSKDNEREADKNGFEMMRAGGYDIRETPELFWHLQENFDKEKHDEPFFFGTHPRLKERVASYKELIKEAIFKQEDLGSVINQENFIRLTHKLVLDNTVLDLGAGRFETAKAGARKYLQSEPNSAEGYFYLAEAYNHQYEQPENKKLKDRQTKEEKKQKALEYYAKAIEFGPAFSLPYKAIGMIYYKDGKRAEAKENLSQYLAKAPQASDYNYVKSYLERLERNEKDEK